MVMPLTHFQCQLEWSKIVCLRQRCSVSSSLRCSLQLSPKLRQESKFLRLKSYTKVTRAIVRDFLFADDCALAAHSEVDLQELADCFATAAVIRANSEHQENWSVETARPRHCSAPTQHHHGWKCAENCRHLQIPRQLHKLCSQPWWWGSVPHLTSKPGIWAPPHPSMHERGISIKTKLSIYQAVVLPSLLYGCKTWTCYRRHTIVSNTFIIVTMPFVHTVKSYRRR